MGTTKKNNKKRKPTSTHVRRVAKREHTNTSVEVSQAHGADIPIDWDTVTEWCNITIGALKAFQTTLSTTTESYKDTISSSRDKSELLLGISGGLKELFSECNEIIMRHSSVDDEGKRTLYTGPIVGEDSSLVGLGLVSEYGSINEKLGQLMSIGYVELLASLTVTPEELRLLDSTLNKYKQDMEEVGNARKQQH